MLIKFYPILITIFPFLMMTFRGGVGLIAAVFLLIAIIQLSFAPYHIASFYKYRWAKLFTVSFSFPVFAHLITQIANAKFNLAIYDGPLRLVASLPILILIFSYKIPFAKYLARTLPLAILFIGAYALFNPNLQQGARLSVIHLDSITWGNYCLVLGFVCLYSITSLDFFWEKSYKFLGLVTGIYFSVLSGSRAGWLAGIILFVCWVFLNKTNLNKKKIVVYSTFFILGIAFIYLNNDIFRWRINAAFLEFTYWINNSQQSTSTGVRLTMWKVAFYLWLQKPWTGYGEGGIIPFLNTPYILSISNQEALDILKCCGVHNEILTNLLHTGVLGILSIVATYILPLILFLKRFKSPHFSQSAQMGIAFIIGVFSCSFFYDMLGLKFAFTFYALMVSGFFAHKMWQITNHSSNNEL